MDINTMGDIENDDIKNGDIENDLFYLIAKNTPIKSRTLTDEEVKELGLNEVLKVVPPKPKPLNPPTPTSLPPTSLPPTSLPLKPKPTPMLFDSSSSYI